MLSENYLMCGSMQIASLEIYDLLSFTSWMLQYLVMTETTGYSLISVASCHPITWFLMWASIQQRQLYSRENNLKPELCIFAWFYGLIWCSYFTEHRYSFCIYISWHPFFFNGGRSKKLTLLARWKESKAGFFPLQTPYGRNLLGLSSKVLCLTVNQRAAGETATQAVNSGYARGGGGGDTIDIALPLPPQSTPLQSTLRYHRRSAADETATSTLPLCAWRAGGEMNYTAMVGDRQTDSRADRCIWKLGVRRTVPTSQNFILRFASENHSTCAKQLAFSNHKIDPNLQRIIYNQTLYFSTHPHDVRNA